MRCVPTIPEGSDPFDDERIKADLYRAKETMSGNALINYWESQNDKLRNLGIRPLTLESLE